MLRSRHSRVICIGAGAAGLYFSTLCHEALVLERNDRPGRKLLITGGGGCNFTHDLPPSELSLHYPERRTFVSPALHAHGADAIRARFRSLSLESVVREDGKVFPRGNDARDVLYALEKASGTVVTGCHVEEVHRKDDHFVIGTDMGLFTSDTLVIATGGLSYPATGSTGDGFAFARSLGHTIVPPRPALCRLEMESALPECEGISLDEVWLNLDGHKARGPILFTRTGVSGPAVMNLSRYATGDSVLRICFRDVDEAAIRSLEGRRKAVNAMASALSLPDRLVRALLPSVVDKTIAQLTKEDLKTCARMLRDFSSHCSTSGCMKTATVTRGGVCVDEVDRKTFASRLCPGLYIIGEALDVDGECGGYNLTFAFASAYAAAEAITTG